MTSQKLLAYFLTKGAESIAICTIIYFSQPIIKISWKKFG